MAPPGAGQIVNAGAPMPAADATLARTDTPLLVAFVDQTQITNVALWPALTSAALDNGWTRTHSCGVTCLEGFGLGLGELGFGVGVTVPEL